MATTFLIQALVLVGIPFGIWLIPYVRRWIPMVIIQISWGFIIGPSILGRANPQIFSSLFPNDSVKMIDQLGLLAVVIFVFLTGMHLDTHAITGRGEHRHGHKGEGREALFFWTISFSSILVPMLLGGAAAAAFWLFSNKFSGPWATFGTFCFALGIATGVTALPVLSAILVETGKVDSKTGKFSLACATVHDGLLWILLAVLITLVNNNGQTHGPHPAMMFFHSTIYLTLMVGVIRKIIARGMQTKFWEKLPDFAKLTLEVIPLFVSCWITESIGIHYLIGAVVYGAILPPQIRKPLTKRVEPFVVAVLLPFFFASAGLKTNFEATSLLVWLVVMVMTTVIFLGQFVGTSLPSHLFFGKSWREATTIATYMSCKGIVEIVVLKILLEANVISDVTYAAMVIVAVLVTGLTKPLVTLVEPRENVTRKKEDIHQLLRA